MPRPPLQLIPVEAPAGADAGEVGEEAHENGLLDGLKIVAQARDERLSVGQPTVIFDTADSPSCSECGSIMVRNGSCYKCINCGATIGLQLITEFDACLT